MPTINCGNNMAKGGRPKGWDVRKRVGTPKENSDNFQYHVYIIPDKR